MPRYVPLLILATLLTPGALAFTVDASADGALNGRATARYPNTYLGVGRFTVDQAAEDQQVSATYSESWFYFLIPRGIQHDVEAEAGTSGGTPYASFLVCNGTGSFRECLGPIP